MVAELHSVEGKSGASASRFLFGIHTGQKVLFSVLLPGLFSGYLFGCRPVSGKNDWLQL